MDFYQFCFQKFKLICFDLICQGKILDSSLTTMTDNIRKCEDTLTFLTQS